MKKNLLSISICALTSLCAHWHMVAEISPSDPTSPHAKAYKSLLAKPRFYESKDKKVRDLKFLAATMLNTLCTDMKRENYPLKPLKDDETNGIEHLQRFAIEIENKLGPFPPVVILAKEYVYDSCKMAGYKTYFSSVKPSFNNKNYFDLFNRFYTPIIQAIWYDYKRATRLPSSIDWSTIKMWAHITNYNEPGLPR